MADKNIPPEKENGSIPDVPVEFLAGIINSSQDAIISYSLEGMLLTWNKSAERIFGYTADEMLGKHISAIVPKEYLNEEEEILNKIKRKERFETYEAIRERKNGERLHVSISASPIIDKDGTIVAVAKILRDITDIKNEQIQLAAKSSHFEQRTNDILDVLLKFVMKDFSQKAVVTDLGDELDAVAAGLNTLGEELGGYIQQIKESDEQIQTIFRNAPDAIVMMDDKGVITSWNPRAEAIFGWKAEEAIGKPLHEVIIPQRYHSSHLQGLQRFLSTGETRVINKPIELHAAKKNGAEFEADIRIAHTVLKGKSHFIGFISDISFRKRAENEIKEKNLFLNTILENIPNMIFVKDADELRFVLLNKAGEQLLGRERNELLGKNDYDFFPKAQADFFTDKDREVLESKELLDIPEEPINTKDGRKWLRTKKIPLLDDKQNAVFLLGISEDITDVKRREDQIRDLNIELQNNVKQLEASNNELESFSYSVSHDLRSPLRAIHGYTQILAEDYSRLFDEEARRVLGKIMGNAQRMGDLIDDLLDFSRLGRKSLTKTTLYMQDMVEGVCAELKSQEQASKFQFVVKNLPPAEGDSVTMRQVWVNLISNAIKYSRPKENAIIEIGAKEEADKVIYYVKDNGVGFDMRFVDKLFGVFQRLHSMDEFEGTGVGLAIVHRIITKHGGRVWAEAKLDEGATFYFSLNKK